MQAMEISRTALDVEWQRLQIVAENLANVNTLGGYQPRRLVSGPAGDFPALLNAGGVEVKTIEPQAVEPRMVHEPGNPKADKNGYVTYPGIDHAAEMTLMIRTSRAYEANVVAMNMAHQMYAKALELGRR
jgi:flagellar basal-body rod protein FlgC